MDDLMTMIDDFDAIYERHRQQVEMLIRRQAASKKVARHLRLGVLRRQLEKGRLPSNTKNDDLIKHFEPDLVKLAISAGNSMARSKGKVAKKFNNVDTTAGTAGVNRGGGSFQPSRPQKKKSLTTRKRPRQKAGEVRVAEYDEPNDETARSFHPLIHVYGNRNSVEDGIHVTEGGACDFYTIKLLHRPKHAVHIAIQDQHLQTIVEPRVIRFNERDWATPQCVCVSAIDDTDKSSDSVESTHLEHVTASGDSKFNDIRFEVPVRISDNDGHYLWGFGSNVHRQFGVDEAGSGTSLPTPIKGTVVATQQSKSFNVVLKNGRRDGVAGRDSEDDLENSSNGIHSDSENDAIANRSNHFGETSNEVQKGNNSPSSNKHSNKHTGNPGGKKISFVTNAKETKPSMLFASIAAGRTTTCATQTNGKTVMHGRNDGLLWYDSREYHGLPFSRSIGTRKTYIIAVSAGTNHCMAINVGGALLAWGMNANGQLGIGDTSVMHVHVPTYVLGPLKGANVIQVNCGNCHTGALSDGKLYTWGCSRTGALGLHDSSPESKKKRLQLPVFVPGLSDVVENDDEGNGNYNKNRKNKRNCNSFGLPNSPTLGSPDSFNSSIIINMEETTTNSSSSNSSVGANRFLPVHAPLSMNDVPFQVDCGWAHTAVLCGKGKLFTCGWGGDGRLGRTIPGHKTGFYEGADPYFRKVQFYLAGANDNKPLLMVNVSCGRKHTLALDSERELWSWGANQHGQLGLGHRISQATPRLVKILRPFSRGAVTKKRHQEKLQREKEQDAQLGRFKQNTKEKDHYDLLAAISCGDSHSCVITEKGLLYVFGNNESSQLGLGDACTDDEVFPRLHHASLSLDVRQVSCGANHTLIVTAETPQRIYHAKSTFDDIMLKHKKLVSIDQRRRKMFSKLVSKAEDKRKLENWRRPISLMIPTTKKAHAMRMTISKKLMTEHRGKIKRPASSASYRGRSRTDNTLRNSRRAHIFQNKNQNSSSRRTMKWENSLSPRPNIDTINSRCVIPYSKVNKAVRPSTAGHSRRFRGRNGSGERPVTRG
jgi:alpha-tubulin suppressor-like RCC1 family protein